MQKQRRRVLVLCAWLRPTMGAGLARFAREANWHLHLDTTITGGAPRHVACDGMLVFHTERADLTALARKRAASCPTVLISGMNPIVQTLVVREDNLSVGGGGGGALSASRLSPVSLACQRHASRWPGPPGRLPGRAAAGRHAVPVSGVAAGTAPAVAGILHVPEETTRG